MLRRDDRDGAPISDRSVPVSHAFGETCSSNIPLAEQNWLASCTPRNVKDPKKSVHQGYGGMALQYMSSNDEDI